MILFLYLLEVAENINHNFHYVCFTVKLEQVVFIICLTWSCFFLFCLLQAPMNHCRVQSICFLPGKIWEHHYFSFSERTTESENNLFWKRPLTSSSSTVNLPLASPSLRWSQWNHSENVKPPPNATGSKFNVISKPNQNILIFSF